MFIQPPYFRETHGLNSVIPSLGLSYLVASLKQHHYHATVLDLEAQRLQFYSGLWKSWHQHRFFHKVQTLYPQKTHLIGIGPVLSLYAPQACFLALLLKEKFPHCRILMGGPHFPKTPEDGYPTSFLTQHPEVDFVFSGEAEYSLIRFLQTQDQSALWKTIPGFHFRIADRQEGFGPPPQRIQNLEELPFPDRSWYLSSKDPSTSYFSIPKRTLAGESVPILASRGCPYPCIFCSSAKTQRYIRSASHIVEELQTVATQYHQQHFIFFDDLFIGRTALEKARIHELCQLLDNTKLNLTWEIDLRADICHYLGVELLQKMYQAGLRIINLGLEKKENNALADLHKHLTSEDIEKALYTLKSAAPFTVCGTFIFGGDSQPKAEIREIVRFAIQLGLDYASFNPLVIHTSRLKKQTALLHQKQRGSRLFVTSSELSPKELEAGVRYAYRKFYFRLGRLLPRLQKIRQWSDLKKLIAEYYYYWKHLF